MIKGNLNKVFRLVYDNEGAPDPNQPDPNQPDPNKPKTLTLTQEELNKMMAENRKKLTQQNSELIKQLEELKEQSNLTRQQKEELETRIEKLQEQSMTKEEIAKKEAQKIQKQAEEDRVKLSQELDSWRNRYSTETVSRSLTDAAVEGKAFNPEQIVEILRSRTSLQDIIGEDGKPTGQVTPIVKFSDINSEGKPVVLDLTPAQAIKRMKEMPQKYGNLFQSDASGGLGGHSGSGHSGAGPSMESLKDLASYQKWRKDHPDLDMSKMRK